MLARTQRELSRKAKGSNNRASSKTCSTCGAMRNRLSSNVRSWTCPCGSTHDRAVDAAKVVLAAGLAVSACGDGVRPART
ncbi:zinc ribbon domain-containing protein [Micromonospora sp. LOL_023]|uniref:zinc ribbon domain-containing protein n=1 Tax=Micromonospora sp. LOL_023 TaxID=3345418 RepID=UPI003A855147